MQEFIDSWGHLGVFIAIIATGMGFPMPEELPVILGGAMANSKKVEIWTMLPVCIVGVIIGDSFLYLIGRLWGTKLVELPFIRKRILTPERLAVISENFQKYGVTVLLFARLTPGIRAPIFLTAGITKLPITYFLVADGIYAIPGVSLLFFLGYWFTDTIIELVEAEAKFVKPIIVLVIISGIGLYMVYRFWRKPMVTGNPSEMPPIVGPVTSRLENVAESVAEKVLHRSTPDGKMSPLIGTTWSGNEVIPHGAREIAFRFVNAVQVTMTDKDGTAEGFWSQTDKNVVMEFAASGTKYSGLIEGGKMQGSATKATATWIWLVTEKAKNDLTSEAQ